MRLASAWLLLVRRLNKKPVALPDRACSGGEGGAIAMDHEDNKYNWPFASVTLVDALRSYIRISENTRIDLLSLGITTGIEEPHLDRCRALLKEIEEYQVDPSLNEILRR